MPTINIYADLEPVPFPRALSNGKRRFNPQRYTEFKAALGLIARQAMHGQAPFTGEVKLYAEFYRPKPKPRRNCKPQVSFIGDVDRYLNTIMDALIGICYADDRQVVDAHAKKIFGEPHITIILEGDMNAN